MMKCFPGILRVLLPGLVMDGELSLIKILQHIIHNIVVSPQKLSIFQ